MSKDEKDENVFYSRLNEFGEYKYRNRLTTLFILQLLFIIILIFIALYYLSIFGLFSRGSTYIVTILLTVILVLILVNKAYVMPKMRSKFIYDTYNFGNGQLKPTTTYKEGGTDGGQSGTSPSQTCTTPQPVCTSITEF
jgi:hypothetical protein